MSCTDVQKVNLTKHQRVFVAMKKRGVRQKRRDFFNHVSRHRPHFRMAFTPHFFIHHDDVAIIPGTRRVVSPVCGDTHKNKIDGFITHLVQTVEFSTRLSSFHAPL